MSAARLALIVLVLAASVVTEARRLPQVFRSTAEGVRVDVRVTRNGASIAGLSAADFELRDNGVVQRLDSAATARFVNVALLVDNTDSVNQKQLATLRDAGRALLDALQTPDDVSLLTVNDKIAAPLGHKSTPGDAKTGLDRISRQATTRTPLWDAIAEGAALISDEAGTRVVVVASDGGDNQSWLTRDAVERALTRSGIVLDWLATKFDYRSYYREPDLTYGAVVAPMEQLVNRTGGAMFQADASDLRRALAQHLTDLRSSYVLTYTPTGVGRDDGWHKLEVRLKSKRADVRARPGYFAGDPKSP